jgi:hypothetical protein
LFNKRVVTLDLAVLLLDKIPWFEERMKVMNELEKNDDILLLMKFTLVELVEPLVH